jgi:predicted RNA-binding Zn-ribbon protein involved in translation (DUF1610 family)
MAVTKKKKVVNKKTVKEVKPKKSVKNVSSKKVIKSKNIPKKKVIKKSNFSKSVNKKNIKKDSLVNEDISSGFDKTTRICPECGSINSQILELNENKFCICNDCGYKAAVFPQVSLAKVDDFKKIILKNKSFQTSSYKEPFYKKGVWSLLGPIIAIIGIIMLFMDQDRSIVYPLIVILVGFFMIYLTFISKD